MNTWIQIRRRGARAATLALLLLVAAAAAAPSGWAQEGDDGGEKDPIILDILDDDALLLISKVDGRDVVRVLGRAQIRHKERTVETDELVYDEDDGYAVMDGDVRLVDTGEEGLSLTAEHLELDLNTELAFARGSVRFERKDARGEADELRHGEFSMLQDAIDDALRGRPTGAVERVRAALETFLPDDEVLLLRGNVDLVDGDRRFQTEFVVINTRDDALVSIGRSAATLPGPGDD